MSDAGEEEGTMAEEQLDPENPEHAFILLEREYTRTVADIEQDPQASQYGEPYTRLFENLFSYYEKGKELTTQCNRLQQELDVALER